MGLNRPHGGSPVSAQRRVQSELFEVDRARIPKVPKAAQVFGGSRVMHGPLDRNYTTTGVEAHTSHEVPQGVPAWRAQFPTDVEGEPDRPWRLHADLINPGLIGLARRVNEHHLASGRLSNRHPLTDHFIKGPKQLSVQRKASYTSIDRPGVLACTKDTCGAWAGGASGAVRRWYSTVSPAATVAWKSSSAHLTLPSGQWSSASTCNGRRC